MLDRVGVVRASLHKELLKVVRGRPRLMLAAAYDSHRAHHDGAVCFLVDATVGGSHGCGLLATLLAPLLATLSALLGILDDDVGRHFPAAAWGWVQLGRLVADDELDGNATQLLGGVLEDVD
jgi:hypothetical protein